MSKIRPKDLPNIGSTYNGGTVMIDGDDGTVKIPASDLFSRFGGLTTGNGLTGSGTSANPIAIDSSILNDINGKQDALEFDGTYDAETNPAATLNTALSTSTDIYLDTENGDDTLNGRAVSKALHTYSRALEIYSTLLATGVDTRIVTLNGSLPVDTATTVRLKVYSPVELSVSFTAETSGGLDISSPENITVDFGTAVVSGNIEMKSGKRLLIGTGNNPSVKEFNMRLQARTVVLGGTLGVVTSNEGTLSVFGGNVHVIADTLDLGISMAYGVSLDVAVYTLNVVNTASFYCKDQNFSDHVSIVATECTGASDPSTISFSGYRVFIHVDTMADGSITPYFFSNNNGPISPLGNDFDINIGKYASPYALIHCVGSEITHNIRVSIGEDGCTSHVGLFVVGQQYTNAKLTGVVKMVPNDLLDNDYTGKGIPAGFYGTYDVIFLNELESSIGNKQDALAFDGTYNATTNKVATVSTVTQAVASLDAPKHVFSGQFTGTVNDLQLDDMLSDGTYTFQLDSTIVSKINTCTNPLIMVTFYAEFWCPFNARPTHDTTSCLLGSMRASTIRGYRVSAPITSINGISSGGDDNFADFGFSIILDNVTNALPLSTFPFEFRNVPSVVVGTRMEWTYSVTIFDK